MDEWTWMLADPIVSRGIINDCLRVPRPAFRSSPQRKFYIRHYNKLLHLQVKALKKQKMQYIAKVKRFLY